MRLLESSHDFKTTLVRVSYASNHAGELFVSVVPPTNQGSQQFSMTVANADGVAMTTKPLKFKVDSRGIERLKQWIDDPTNDMVTLNNFIRMFKEDGTILSSKKFRNLKIILNSELNQWRNSCINISSGFDSVSRMIISMNQ